LFYNTNYAQTAISYKIKSSAAVVASGLLYTVLKNVVKNFEILLFHTFSKNECWKWKMEK
jgi:hypothetical protein